MDEQKIALFMKNLDITREEAIQIIKDDDAIDHGAKLFELSDEQKKVAKVMKNESSKQRTAPTVKEKKADPAKDEVYNYIYSALESMDSNLVGSDNHREITFMNEGKKFKITISCPRS